MSTPGGSHRDASQGRRTDRAGPPADPVDRLVGQRVGRRCSGRAGRGPRSSAEPARASAAPRPTAGSSFASLTRQRPVSCSTMSLESSSSWTSRAPELARQLEGPDDAGVLGHVVRLDRRDSRRSMRPARREWSARRAGQVEQRRAEGRRAGIATRRAVGPDHEPRGSTGRWPPAAASAGSRGRDGSAQTFRSTIAPLTSRIAWVMLMPRGQASVQLKIVRQRHTPSLSARISSRSSAAVVARVEDEPVGVDDRRRPDV